MHIKLLKATLTDTSFLAGTKYCKEEEKKENYENDEKRRNNGDICLTADKSFIFSVPSLLAELI